MAGQLKSAVEQNDISNVEISNNRHRIQKLILQ